MRPQLVTTALAERAAGNFQFTALLMSNHTDMLCELTDGLDNPDTVGVAGLATEETVSPRETNASKHKAKVEPSRVAKKAAQNPT